MRAAVLNGVYGAGLVTPHHEVFRKTSDADRRAGHSPTRQHRIPEVQQSAVHAILDSLAVNHCYSSKCERGAGSGPGNLA